MDIMKTIFSKNENVITRVVAGETILVPISGNIANMQHIFSLNEVGEVIWENIDGINDISQIIDSVIQEFNISAEKAEKDCVEFVESLRISELIEVVTA